MSTKMNVAVALILAAVLAVFAMAASLTVGSGLSVTGTLPLSTDVLGGFGIYQGIPFILGGEIGGPPVLGWDVSPWAFGVQSCVRSLPLYFGAHGFGFPFTLGNYRIGVIPSCC